MIEISLGFEILNIALNLFEHFIVDLKKGEFIGVDFEDNAALPFINALGQGLAADF